MASTLAQRAGVGLEVAARVGTGALLLWAGSVKVADPQQFAIDVHNYQLTPWDISVLVSFYLPWLEILTGLALLVRRFYAGALAITAGLMLLFLGALVSARQRGLDISCGCFGSGTGAIDLDGMIARDLVLLAVVGALAWWEARRSRAERLVRPESPPAGAVA